MADIKPQIQETENNKQDKYQQNKNITLPRALGWEVPYSADKSPRIN